jgi:repressor LexA
MARKPVYLTERQRDILEYIQQFQRERGIAPTHREICERFGYSSYGTVYKHLKLLQQKGFLRKDWNQKRGIELLRPVPGGADAVESSVELPYFGRIAAGMPLEAVSGDETLNVPHHLLGRRRGEHYVLEVVGESMIDEGIHEGDLVIVLQRELAEPGDMVVALIGTRRRSSASTPRATPSACSRPTRTCSRSACRRATSGCRGLSSA